MCTTFVMQGQPGVHDSSPSGAQQGIGHVCREEMEDLDVLVAEQRLGEALKLLRSKEKQLAAASSQGEPVTRNHATRPADNDSACSCDGILPMGRSWDDVFDRLHLSYAPPPLRSHLQHCVLVMLTSPHGHCMSRSAGLC